MTQPIKPGKIGMKLASAEVVLTASGRPTTPFPNVIIKSSRGAAKCIQAVNTWLMSNALAEALSRGDEFNARWMKAALEKPTQADKDCAEQYLFTPQPPVPQDFLKPLAIPNRDEQALLGADFKLLQGSTYIWLRAVFDGPNTKHLYTAKLVGDGKVQLSRATSFPGTSVTGCGKQLGRFESVELALDAVQEDLGALMPQQDLGESEHSSEAPRG